MTKIQIKMTKIQITLSRSLHLTPSNINFTSTGAAKQVVNKFIKLTKNQFTQQADPVQH